MKMISSARMNRPLLGGLLVLLPLVCATSDLSAQDHALPGIGLPGSATSMTVTEAIHDADGDFIPDRLGQYAELEGVIGGYPVSLGALGAATYAQDEHGIVVFSPDASELHALKPGDRIRVVGWIGQFRGLPQIAVDSIWVLGKVPPPHPIELRLGDVDESKTSMLVRVSGVLDVRRTGETVSFRITDDSGELPVLLHAELLAESGIFDRITRAAGRTAVIQGILLQDTSRDAPTDGYYLLPRNRADLVLPRVFSPLEFAAGGMILLFLLIAGSLIWRRRRAEREARESLALAERLRASEAALRESERRYRLLFENVPIGLYQITTHGDLLSANGTMAEILGFESIDAVMSAGVTPRYVNREAMELFHRRLSTEREVTGFEAEWTRIDGAVVSVRQSGRAVRDDAGRILFFEGSVEDITERRRAEESRREAEARMRHLLSTSPTIIYSTALEDGRASIAWISENVQRILGFTLSEALRPNWFPESLHPEDREATLGSTVRFLSGLEGREMTTEYRFRHRDGSYRWFRNDLRIVEKSDGRTIAVGASVDVTAQKEATLALGAAEAHYRRLVETSPYGIFAIGADDTIVEANAALATVLGLKLEEILGTSMWDLVLPESEALVTNQVAQLASDPEYRPEIEIWVERPSGERRLVQTRVAPIMHEGAFVGMQGVVRDITDERRKDARIQLLAMALENLGHGVAVTDSSADFVYTNSAFCEILGIPAAAEAMPSARDLLPDEPARAQNVQIEEALRQTGRWSGRIWRRRAVDGSVIPLDSVMGLVPAPDGRMPHTLLICENAVESLQREQQLRRAERLSSLGTLVGGVAHELNNPLNAIINFAALLLAQTLDDTIRDDLETIVREGERAAKIVSNLGLIGKEASIEQSPKEKVDLNDVVRHVLKLRAYSLATTNISVEVRLADPLPAVWADRGQLEQVVLNLLVNAEQAIASSSPEGSVVVATCVADDEVRLEIADDGPGIPSNQIERIFDPFWTTKAPGQGTGLGLSLVHNIVTENGGVVDVRSRQGAGATFEIRLPVAACADDPPELESFEPSAHEARMRILVVEDEPAVRRSLVRYLQRQGHAVEEAAEGGEALTKLARTAPFDIILSDLKMPGLSGEQLFKRLKDAGAGLERRIVFMTGDASGADAARVLPEAPVLIKPMKFSELERTIRLQLDACSVAVA